MSGHFLKHLLVFKRLFAVWCTAQHTVPDQDACFDGDFVLLVNYVRRVVIETKE